MPNGFLGRGYGAPNFGVGRIQELQSPLGQLQTMANILATPQRIEMQNQQAALDRAVLTRLGLSDADARTMIPDPSFNLPGGVAGKVLSGLGTVGGVLSTVLGAPIQAPRADVGQLIAAEQLGRAREKVEAQETAGGLARDLVTNPQDAEIQGAFVEELFRAGLGGSAVSLIKGKPAGTSLGAVLARRAEGKTGRPLGDPATDSELLKNHILVAAAIQAAKDQATFNVDYDPGNVVNKAKADSLHKATTAAASEAGKQSASMQKLAAVLPMVKQAVQEDFWADDWSSRMLQYGAFNLALSAPENARLVGMDLPQEKVTRLQAVGNMIAFAGLFLRAPGIDVGRLSDQDIQRVSKALVRFSDAKQVATAKLAIWDELLTKANAGMPGHEIERLAQRILDLDRDSLIKIPGGPQIGGDDYQLDLQGPPAGKTTGGGTPGSSPEPTLHNPGAGADPTRSQNLDSLLDALEAR